MCTPFVTIVMSAASTRQAFFIEAVESCLKQNYPNYELIIVDDGLSAENRDYLSAIDDSRLRIIKNSKNRGQSYSVNKGIALARGEYIIRMDADDVMLPSRLFDEVQFMEVHPDVLVAGALAVRSDNLRVVPRRYSSEIELKIGMMFTCDMVHPTMIIRKELAISAGLMYDVKQQYAQDYMYWADAISKGEIAQIPTVVLRYRVHSGQISNKKTSDQRRFAGAARSKILINAGFRLDDNQLALFSHFCTDVIDSQDIPLLRALISQLLTQSKTIFEKKEERLFCRELSFRMVKAFARAVRGQHDFSLLRVGYLWKSLLAIKNWRFYYKGIR